MPLPELTGTRVAAPASEGIGLEIPPREADCSQVRPSWYPFQMNVCDSVEDVDPPEPFSGRQLTLPEPPAPIPFEPIPSYQDSV
jgi:hypothetical protein